MVRQERRFYSKGFKELVLSAYQNSNESVSHLTLTMRHPTNFSRSFRYIAGQYFGAWE
jgi:hypothetical protein